MHQRSIYLTMLALSASVATKAENPDAVFQTYPTYSGEDLELTVDSKGSEVQPFKTNDWNRVVIMVAE